MSTTGCVYLEKIYFRAPRAADGYALQQLIQGDAGLDENSLMCNLLQCTHFADTSVAALLDDQLVGFISAYRLPTRPRSLFVWQLVVAGGLRGQGLGKTMLRWLLQQPGCEEVLELTAAITPDNIATWKLFDSFARECEALPVKTMLFSRDEHFKYQHDDQYLLSISPLPNREPLKTMSDHLEDMRGYTLGHISSRRWLD